MWFVAVARIGQTNGSLVVADCSAAPAYSAACAQCTASAYIQRGLPKTGQGLILPACNTEAKNLCLAEPPRPSRGTHATLLGGQAGGHMST